jgi:peroxiredoxin Q/BCP
MDKMVMDHIRLAKVGEEAPDFILNDTEGKPWCLSEKRGQVVALLFYPQDETLVCTKQMCSVRDNWAEYMKTGAKMIGISDGSVESHSRFAAHHNLPIPLLADMGNSVTKMFSHHWWMPAKLTRAIVVINADGIVLSRKVMFRAFRPNDDEVIAAILYAKTELVRKS